MFSETPAALRLVPDAVLGALHDCAGSGYTTSGSARVLVRRGWGTNADALKPFAISHTPMNTSHRPPGSENRSPRPDPMTAEAMPTRMVALPSRPQMASQRGTKFALYNVEHSSKPDIPSVLMAIS